MSHGRYGGVIASGPPWSTIVAGGALASAHSLPLILDYRDPWTLPVPFVPESGAHPLGRLLAERAERAALRLASAVIMNTPTAERAMSAKYPDVRFETILNGVDDLFLEEGPAPTEPFRIVYAGTIYIDRDPRPLFAAVGELVRRLDIGPRELEVEFIGDAASFNGVPTERLAEEAGISEHFRLLPTMPRDELVAHLKRASVLVSLPQSTPWSIPSKIYEYLGYGAHMIVFTDATSGTAEILKDSDAIVLEPFDHDGTVAALHDCYRAHREGTAARDRARVEPFARERRGRELQALLEEIGVVAEPALHR